MAAGLTIDRRKLLRALAEPLRKEARELLAELRAYGIEIAEPEPPKRAAKKLPPKPVKIQVVKVTPRALPPRRS